MAESSQPVAVSKKSGYRPVLLTLLCSLLLGGGTCAGFLSTTFNENSNRSLSMLLAFAFAACVLTFVGSLVWLVVKAVRGAMKSPGGAP